MIRRSIFLNHGLVVRYIILFALVLLAPLTLSGAPSYKGGKWSPEKYAPTTSVQEHYDMASQAFNANRWDEALTQYTIVIHHFKNSPFFADALFYSGVCNFYKDELDLANQQFESYLSVAGKLKHFQQVFDFKYQIAEAFRKGKKKHLFGFEDLPKWSSAKGNAVVLYDEIIAALPASDLAAQSLYSKAKLLRKRKDYKGAIEALKTLTRRFPKHELSAEGYLLISKIYLDQSKIEAQNPDLIALSRVNLQNFASHFPGDERIEQAKGLVTSMQEIYASSLFDMGRFYERKKKPHASEIYYHDTIRRYPESEAANKSRDRLTALGLESPPSELAEK